MHTRGMQIVRARIGLASNNPDLAWPTRYIDQARQEQEPHIWSLLSALHRADEIPYGPDLDAYLTVIDQPDAQPSVVWNARQVVATADFTRLERDAPDRRRTLFGNAGLLSKLVYTTLERVHGILSFHATAMLDETKNHLYVVVGSAGAGKTVLLLEGVLRRSYSVFSTEMTHLGFGPDGLVAYKGSLYDNIRIGNLLFSFPDAGERLRLPDLSGDNPWQRKICASFVSVESPADVLRNPTLTFLFPNIEADRREAVFAEMGRPGALAYALFENASEMIVRPRVYYNEIPFTSFEQPDAAERRWDIVMRLVREARIEQALSIVASPADSMHAVR